MLIDVTQLNFTATSGMIRLIMSVKCLYAVLAPTARSLANYAVHNRVVPVYRGCYACA